MRLLLTLRLKFKELLMTFNKTLKPSSKLLTKSTDLLSNSMKKIILTSQRRLRKFKFSKYKWERSTSKEFLTQFSVLVTYSKTLLNKVTKMNNKWISTTNYILLNNLWENRCHNFSQENFSVKERNHLKTCKASPITNFVSHSKARLYRLKWNFKRAITNMIND